MKGSMQGGRQDSFTILTSSPVEVEGGGGGGGGVWEGELGAW